jgi:hypothetical protein
VGINAGGNFAVIEPESRKYWIEKLQRASGVLRKVEENLGIQKASYTQEEQNRMADQVEIEMDIEAARFENYGERLEAQALAERGE